MFKINQHYYYIYLLNDSHIFIIPLRFRFAICNRTRPRNKPMRFCNGSQGWRLLQASSSGACFPQTPSGFYLRRTCLWLLNLRQSFGTNTLKLEMTAQPDAANVGPETSNSLAKAAMTLSHVSSIAVVARNSIEIPATASMCCQLSRLPWQRETRKLC